MIVSLVSETATSRTRTDISCLPTQLGWVDLAIVLDQFSLKVIEARRPDANSLLHHSDRGSQYTIDDYQQAPRIFNITCSMSRTGCCDHNAAMERLFCSLKHEWTKFDTVADISQTRITVLRASVFQTVASGWEVISNTRP